MDKIKMKHYFKKYRYLYLFIIFSILFEFIGVYSVEGRFRIEKPLILFVTIFFLFVLLFFLNQFIAKILAVLFLVTQGFLNVVFKIVYVMQGHTVFTFSQLKFIKEGTGIVTTLKIDYLLILNYIILLIIYLILICYKREKGAWRVPTIKSAVIRMWVIAFCTILFSAVLIRIVRDSYFDYQLQPYSTPRKYQTLGVTGNFINELFFYNKVPNPIEEDDVDEFLFSDKVNSNTHSRGNNLIIILVETFEWYSFIQDQYRYPNGLQNLTDEELEYLFPNLTKFYKESLKMTNYYSHETTIYSETLSILGNHSYKSIPTYDHTFANYEYSLVNMFKKKYPKVQTSYYHNNNISFYGRGSIMNHFGFDDVYGAERLIDEYKDQLSYSELKLTDIVVNGITDASMFEVAKEKMFPIEKQFLTYITTLTMHGSFENYRSSLYIHYDKLNSFNKPIFSNDKTGKYLKNYIASVLNFDLALGIMMDYLEEKKLLDHTTIVLLSDHQAYSNDLSFLVREEPFYHPIAFNVPFMIYDKNLGNGIINKFTTNIDVVPTIFDLFGIDYYLNFYYGNSIFLDKESVTYSFYYGRYLTDKILFNTLNNVSYLDDTVDENYIVSLEENIKAMFKKIMYVDQWYYYYSNKKKEEE